MLSVGRSRPLLAAKQACRRRMRASPALGASLERGRACGETQLTQILDLRDLAVFAVLRPTPPTRGASVSADGLGLHARCGRWPPLLVWRPPLLADRCGGRRLLGPWRVASRALWRARARRPC